MPAKRLLVVSDEMEVAGSQRQIAHFLCNIDHAEWQPELLYFRRPSFLLEQIAASGTPVHQIPKNSAIAPNFVLRLVRFLRRGRYDVIHCFSLTAELWVSIAHALVRRPALIVSMRDMGDMLTPRQWTIKRALCRNADAIISNSQRAADRLARELGGRRPIDVVPNGIAAPRLLDAGRRAEIRATLPIARRDAVVALFVGRLATQKNVPLLLDAIAGLPAAQRPELLLAGSGPLQAQLATQADALGIAADVSFLGERSDVGDLMQAVDLLVLPSLDEGLSNVVLEAMASGLAVIASRVGGNPEVIVDGESGLLFDSGDRTALIAHLRALIGDRTRRETLGRAARERIANHYSIDALVARTCAIYRRVLDAKAVR